MKTFCRHIFSWVVILCRVAVGLLVIRTGFDLISRQGSFVHWHGESDITGVFVIILGAFFTFSSLLHKLFNRME